MNSRLSTIALTSLLLFGTSTLAHEGHNQVPGQIKALHGGVVKAGTNLNMEMLASADSVKFFPLAHSGEDLKITEVKLSGTAKAPKKKPETLTFTSDGKSFTTQVDLKGSHRSDLEIKATYSGKTDTFKFLVEK